jgi:hypothetical protein
VNSWFKKLFSSNEDDEREVVKMTQFESKRRSASYDANHNAEKKVVSTFRQSAMKTSLNTPSRKTPGIVPPKERNPFYPEALQRGMFKGSDSVNASSFEPPQGLVGNGLNIRPRHKK